MHHFYHIYALGFCGAEKNNSQEQETKHRLHEVTQILPRLKVLGVKELLIGPVFQSETHGYDTIDYYQVDKRLGDEADLKNLVYQCHEQGIQVILDCVFNHVSRSHFAFKDLQMNGQNSMFKDWFKGIDFNRRSPYGDTFDYETWDGHYQLVKLNLQYKWVREYLIEVALYWCDTFDIDGLRMDAANVMDHTFLRELSRACKSRKPGFFMLGEIVGGDYCHLAKASELDAVTNYECYKGLYSSLNDANYFEIAYALNRQFGPNGQMRDIGLYNFVDNHDVNRVATELKREAHLYPLYLLLYTMPGIPSLYYLSEYGQKGKRTKWSDEELRTPYRPNEHLIEHPLFQTICRLSKIRNELKALVFGDYHQISVSAEQLVFERSFQEEKIIVILNASKQIVYLNLPHAYHTKAYDVLNHQEVDLGQSVEVYAEWGRILILSGKI